MPIAPQVAERAEQPYVAVKALVTMQAIGTASERLAEVFAWLVGHGVAPAGAPFLKYNVIDMMRQLEIEAGVPVAAAIDGDGPGGTAHMMVEARGLNARITWIDTRTLNS